MGRYCLDSGKQVFISPVVDSRGRPAKLDLHSAFHQFCHKLLVRIAGRHHAAGVVRLVVQRHVARVGMKDRYDLGLGLPIGDVFRDEPKMKDGGRYRLQTPKPRR